MSSYSASGAAVHSTAAEATVRPRMRSDAWLERAAQRRPERVALECGADVLTYRELHARAAVAAAGLRAGAPVAIDLPPGTDFVVAFHACMLAGAVAVPVDPRLTEEQRQARLRTAAAVAAQDVAMVVHTSGTTSEPK